MALVGTKVRIQRPRHHDLLKRFVLRFRDAGHLRFDLPRDVASSPQANRLVAALLALEGVYRVLVFAGSGKLSIRFDPAALEERQVIKHLASAVSALPEITLLQDVYPSHSLQGVREKLQAHRLARWGGEKWRQGRQTVQAMSQRALLKAGQDKPLPFGAKEWGIHFVNDLVAFYLIRVHWTRITQQWLPNPWAFRYQWMTIIYLTYVLVRYRKAVAKKSAAK